MKYLSFFMFILLLTISCQNRETGSAETTTPVETAEYVLYEVQIEGMTCTGCEQTVEGVVKKMAGVGAIDADFTVGTAQPKFVEGKTDTTAVREVIESSGYKVVSFEEVSETGLTE